jgi:hypothetical protein
MLSYNKVFDQLGKILFLSMKVEFGLEKEQRKMLIESEPVNVKLNNRFKFQNGR